MENKIDNKTASRRGFIKNIAASVAAAGALVPMGLSAKDDPALIEEPEWGKKLGDPVDKNLYGMPSPYEHNVVRRVHKLLSSGDMYASVAMCPVQDLSGIITPNGLFFHRS
ncbi:MAG TPA: twin-arginine translocation signal domain-containing protein, partial [Nitratifractor sp.]|nr:twin-arginine translocation signal domain-containing protein [Nitratifractor sp.]